MWTFEPYVVPRNPTLECYTVHNEFGNGCFFIGSNADAQAYVESMNKMDEMWDSGLLVEGTAK
jgi:hypothetical protein